MYRMTVRQAIGLDPSYGQPAPSTLSLAEKFLAAQGVPVSAIIKPVMVPPTALVPPVATDPEAPPSGPITYPPASTGPAPPPSGPPVVQPGPPTLAVPPGAPVYPGGAATPTPFVPGDVVAPLPGNGNGQQQPPVSWWDARSDIEKGAVVLGGVAVLGGLAYLAFGKSKMRPNRATPRRATGEVITLKGGQRWGHTIPPKEYRTQGATRKSDYAWPDGYKYPLVFRRSDGTVNVAKSQRHVRSAATYFARYKQKYPPRVRREIASNINRAKKRFDVGGKPATP